jgi:hypothetical protein
MKRLKHLLTFFFIAIATIGMAQPADSIQAEILEILELLENEEKAEMVIVTRSQRKVPPADEISWLLSNMDEKSQAYVLKYIKMKAGSRLKKTDVAEVYWSESAFHFRAVKEGTLVSHDFEFENISNVPYLISTVEGSCGCTIANYPKTPIPPGGKGKITVQFNSKGKKGEHTEFVTVVGNTHPNTTSLIIEANVY